MQVHGLYHLLLACCCLQAAVDFAGCQCDYNGQIRLVGGSTQYEGRVEICLGVQWGTVCENMWDTADATVVCRELGYATTGAIAFSGAHFGPGSGPIHADDVQCTGSEFRLNNCPYNAINTCNHGEDAGVRCEVTCTHGDIRLMDGVSSMEGRVEVCLFGVWGTVCDNGWSEVDANVACRQLGYSGSDATVVTDAAIFGQGFGLIALNNVACTAYEPRLIDCPNSNNSASCSHSDDSGVLCVPQCTDGRIRLMGVSSNMTGRVEVCVDGNWGTVCDDGWSTVDANVACRQLGFSNSDATAYSGARFGQGSSLIIALDEVSCVGEEASLFSCMGTANHDCTHAEDASVLCSAQCENGAVRLSAGSYPFEGRVEVCVNGVWGSVCHDSWSTTDASVACRQLGYSTYDVVAYSNAQFGEAQLPILLDDVACTGSEPSLTDCPYDNNTVDCSHTQDAGTRCHSIPLDVSLNTRIVGTANGGEVKYYNFPFHSSGITFRLDVDQGSLVAYASDVTEAPNILRGHVWQIQTSTYDDLFFDPQPLGRAAGSTVYVALEGMNSSNSFVIGAVAGNATTSALVTGTPVTHTVGGGTTNYHMLAFPSGGVTITLDVTQGTATLYVSDDIWNLNAESYDWRIQTSTYGEDFLHPSELNRTVGDILFLGILGRETANAYVLNNFLGDTTTEVPLAPSNIQVTDVDETTATLTWTAPTPNIVSPLSPITSYQLILSTQQNGIPNVTVSVTTNFNKFLGLEEFTVYACIIAATNGVGQGQFSSPISFTTSETAPAVAPQQASGSSPTSTSIFLTWSPPPAVSINGIIDYYMVEVTENRTGRLWTLHSPNLYLTLDSLHPYYIYDCRVAAFTVGLGPFTPYFQVVTAEDVPTETPVNFTVTGITSRTVSLLWYPLPFEHQNGVIRQYIIAANRTDNPLGFQLTSNTTELTVENLPPNRTYTFAVAAETIEVGPFTPELTASLPEDVPDEPPQRVRGTATNATALFLTWDPPPFEEQNGIIRQYLINITETETGDTVQHSIATTSITIPGLHPFYNYVCIVAAVTVGEGPYSSSITIQTLQTAPGTSPRNFEGNATSSRSISLTWDPPLFEDQNGVIIGYTINVTLLETGEDFQLSTNAHSLMLHSLQPFVTYNFIIAAETVVSGGPFSTVLTIATPEDIPTEPRNPDIQTIAGSPTELLVMWDPPAEPNGIVLTYSVYCYVLSNDSAASEIFLLPLDSVVTMMPSFTQVPGNQTEVAVIDLVPYTNYICVITANTSVGESNSSGIVSNRTDESVPANPPSNFKAVTLNSTAILLTWSDPPTPYGIVVSYNISYNLSEVPDFGSGMNSPLMMDYTEAPASVLVDAGDENSYLVTGLNEYTLYAFEIFASTRVGPGPFTQAVTRTHDTNPHAPPQNIQSSDTGSRMAVVSWTPPPFEDQNGIITYYLLLIMEEQFNISDRVINTTSDVTAYTVTGLEEYNNYTCRVAAATRIGPGPYSASIAFSTIEDVPTAPPQSLSGFAQGSRDIMLMWSPPPPIHINGILNYYVAKVTERETGDLLSYVAATPSLLVGDLHPHYHYDCMVAAFTVGEGPFTNNFTVQTAEEPPSATPSTPVMFGATPVSLSLNWTMPPFHDQNGIIRNYLIAIREHETSRDFTESSNTTQVTLLSLHPFYTYTCSIAAVTVGTGPFSGSITVQLPEAAPASPPTNITGRALDSTTIALSWSQPLPADRNGIIRSYTISVTEQDTGRQFSRTFVNNTEESFHALHPFYVYLVTVSATTVASGPPSTPIEIQTEEDIPSAPPLNVTVVETTFDLVTLKWDPPLREHHNGVITGYLISLTVVDTGETLQYFSNTSNMTIEGLMPHTTYTFVVAAETFLGSGPFSDTVSVLTEETAPNSPPQNLTVTALTPYSITLTWSPPPPQNQNGIIREYRINITEVETGMELNYFTAATSLTVPLLHPYYTYDCVISAYTVAFGPYTEVITVMTPEDVPTASPQDFAAANTSSRSVALMWEPPPPEQQNGNITHYIINASVVGSGEMFQLLSDSALLLVNNLTPFTTYLLVVAATNNAGTGPFTFTILTVQTPEDVPTSPPLNPVGVPVNSRTILLSWEPPPAEERNGILRHYIVRIMVVETRRVMQQNSTITTLQVPLLHPYYTYEWNVSGYTVGEGPQTNLSSVRTPEDVPFGSPQDLMGNATSHNSIYLSWNPPITEEQNGVIVGYTVNITSLRSMETQQFILMAVLNLSVDSLIPHTTYSCTVAAHTTIGAGPFSQEILVQTLQTAPSDSPNNIIGVPLNSTHILVRWDPPPEDRLHGNIQEYRINVTGMDDGIMLQLTSDVNETQITVGSLHPYYIYTITVAAVTIAEGPSDSVTVRTNEDAPADSPVNFTVRTDTSRSLTFSWEPPLPEHQNGIIRHYVIVITSIDGSFNVSTPTAGTTHTVLAPIRPFVTYVCNISAETVAVGPASGTIQVQTPQDVPEAPPQEVIANATNSRTLVLSWEPPDSIYRNGIIIKYTINITEYETDLPFDFVIGNTTSLTIPRVHPFYRYSYAVAAETEVGLGPYSTPRMFQMPEDAPTHPPFGLVASWINSSAFFLSWNAPPPEHWNGIIREYIIPVTEQNTGREFLQLSLTTEIALESLHPYYNYTCTVAAMTMGLGPFSTSLTVTTSEDVPTGSPTQVTGTPVNSTSLSFTWGPPPAEDQNGIIIRYTIRLTTVDTDEVSVFLSNITEIVIGSLHPHTAYRMSVAAETIVGLGPYTANVTNITPEDAPSAPPMFLNYTQLTSISVHLEWIPPPPEHVNGIIRQYTLTWIELETGRNFIRNPTETSYTVGNMHPFYNYNFSVCAVTMAQGPCADAYTIRTLESIPSASPQNFQAVPLSSTTLSLTWQPPPLDKQNGIILGYFINTTELETDQHFQNTSNTTSLMLNELHPYYRYSFKIAAETVVGRGPFSQAHLALTLEDVPIGPPTNVTIEVLSSSSILITWMLPHPSLQNGIISGFTILLTSLQNGSVQEYHVGGTALSLQIEGLKKFSSFRAAVASMTVVGTGPNSTTDSVRTMEDVPDAPGVVTYEIVTETAITVHWSPPENANGILLNYQIIYQGYSLQANQSGQSDGPHTRNVSLNVQPSFVITNLIQGLRYEFKVRARTAVGYGENSTLTVTIAPIVVPVPSPLIDTNTLVIVIVVLASAVLGWLTFCCLCCFYCRGRKSKKYNINPRHIEYPGHDLQTIKSSNNYGTVEYSIPNPPAMSSEYTISNPEAVTSEYSESVSITSQDIPEMEVAVEINNSVDNEEKITAL